MAPPARMLEVRLPSASRIHALANGLGRHAVARIRGTPCWTAVTLLVTFRCNCRCVYCDFPRHAGSELSTESCLRLLQGLRRAGTVRLGFSGGEPLLRPDLPELLREAHRLGFVVSLTTNGLLLPDGLDLLRSVDYLLCTVEGRPETHDQIKGPGAHARTVKALRLASAHPRLRLGLICPVHQYNIAELEAPLLLAESLEARIYYQPVQTREGWTGASIEGQTDTSERLAAFRQIEQWKRQGRAVGNSLRYLRLVTSRSERAGARTCSAGRHFVTILPDGRVTPCCMLPFDDDLPRLDPQDPLAVAHLVSGRSCEGCSISPYVESSFLMNLDPWAWWEALHW